MKLLPVKERVVKPFFTYFGGKYRIAAHYPSPTYSTVIEPFAGSAGYSLRHAHRNVVLVDKNPIITGLWKYLINVSAREILRLPDLEPDQSVDELSVCQEARWLIGFWLNKGATGLRKTPSKWMRSRIRPNSYWGKMIRVRIAFQLDAIRHWKVIEGGYEDVPVVKATWFIDPPYQSAGHLYPYSDIDYLSLAKWCLNLPGQVIVCESQGADWLPFAHFRDIRTTPGARGKGKGTEMIWTN